MSDKRSGSSSNGFEKLLRPIELRLSVQNLLDRKFSQRL